jgi:hypothetical protein
MQFCVNVNNTLRHYGAGLEVAHSFWGGMVQSGQTVRQAIGSLSKDQKFQILAWLNKNGPFWDRPALHDPEEYFECQGELVTKTALGEAAYLTHEGANPVVVSLPNSRYTSPTLTVTCDLGKGETIPVQVTNTFTLESVESIASSCERDFESYEDLIRWAQRVPISFSCA